MRYRILSFAAIASTAPEHRPARVHRPFVDWRTWNSSFEPDRVVIVPIPIILPTMLPGRRT